MQWQSSRAKLPEQVKIYIHKYVKLWEVGLFWFVEEPIFTKIRSRVRLIILTMSASRDTVLQPSSSTFNLLGNKTNSLIRLVC